MIYAGLLAAAACCGGMVAASRFLLLPLYGWGLAAVAALLACVAVRRRTYPFLLALSLASCFLGAARMEWAEQQYERLPHYLGGAAIRMEGTIQETGYSYQSEKGERTRYVVALEQYAYAGDDQVRRGEGCLFLTVPASDQWQPSARVAFQGVVKPISYYHNRGGYDTFHRDRNKDIFLKAYSDDEKSGTVLAGPSGWRHWLAQRRREMTERFQTVLSPDHAHMLSSLLFGGHYDKLPPELIESFSTTGLIHILSVSGSHIALLLSAVQLAGRAAGLKAGALFVLSAAFVLVYGAMAEFSAPVIRASIMGIISAYSLVARREYIGAQALGLAVLAMVWHSPYSVYDISFQLSCGASAGIVLFQPRIRPLFSRLPTVLADSMTVCLCAQVLVLPLLLAHFSSVPVYAVPANFFIGSVLDVTIVLGLIAAVCGIVCEPVGQAVLTVISPLLSAAVKGNAFLAALPHSRYWAGALSVPVIASWYLAVASVLLPMWRRRLLTAAAVLIVLSSVWGRMQRPEAVVHVFDLGRDKATCVIYDDSSAHLWYNGSQWANPQGILTVLTPALRYEGVFRLASCTVWGYDGETRAAQLASQFILDEPCRILSQPPGQELTAGPMPYGLYDRWDGKACQAGPLEIQTLPDPSLALFPSQAPVLILHDQAGRNEGYIQWREGAELYDIPCFSPCEDGQITGIYRRGMWTFFTCGGDDR